MTPDEVEAIRERVEAATPGPWDAPHEHARTRCVSMGDFGWVTPGAGPHYDEDTEQAKADAEFIAHARTDVPALLAALAEAQRERDDARATHQELATEFERLRDGAELMRPVVEAARALRAAQRRDVIRRGTTKEEMFAKIREYEPIARRFELAVDTYEGLASEWDRHSGCAWYAETGMHWDTCPNRDRSDMDRERTNG